MPGLVLALVLLALASLLYGLAGLLRRRLARAARLRRLAEHRGLSREALDLARALAARAGAEPFALLTRLDLFELATAGAGEHAPEVRQLRQALGFDRLPPHAPLLTTRELRPGTALVAERGALAGQVVEVDESSFELELPRGLLAPPGEVVELSLDHAHEARYRLRCPLIGSAGAPDASAVRLRLGHDEAPLRVQRRAFARVTLREPFDLHPLAALVPHGGAPEGWSGLLVDVSGGGALAESRGPLPVGLLGRLSFAVGEARFEGLRAVVLASSRAGEERWRSHLELVRIAEGDRDQLVAAVARASHAQLAFTPP